MLTNGGEVVSRPRCTPRKIPRSNFCWRLCPLQGHNAAGRIRTIEKSSKLIGGQTRDLPTSSVVSIKYIPRAIIVNLPTSVA
jgi:hypothetical protein